MNQIMQTACHICHGKNTSKHHSRDGFDIDMCQTCRLQYVRNIPLDLSPYYDQGYFTGDVSRDGYMDYDTDKQATVAAYERVLDDIAVAMGGNVDGRSLFEVGAATGFFLDLAKKRGYHATGIDVSDYAAKTAQSRGLDVKVGGVTDVKKTHANTQDVVVMFDVIEHVQNPRRDIAAVYHILKPGGVFALITPDAGSIYARVMGKHWHAYVPPQHLFYFTRANLRMLLEEQSFQVLSVASHNKKFALPYLFRALYSWQKVRVWKWLAQKTNQSPTLKHISLPIPLYDTMIIIAKKV